MGGSGRCAGLVVFALDGDARCCRGCYGFPFAGGDAALTDGLPRAFSVAVEPPGGGLPDAYRCAVARVRHHARFCMMAERLLWVCCVPDGLFGGDDDAEAELRHHARALLSQGLSRVVLAPSGFLTVAERALGLHAGSLPPDAASLAGGSQPDAVGALRGVFAAASVPGADDVSDSLPALGMPGGAFGLRVFQAEM